MLIYVIPLVIVVIALVFLKKRQSAQESDKANAQKAKAKKASSSAKIAPNRTQAVEAAVKPTTTALNDDTRKKIQSLIDEGNFFSAEAQINQALKKDNTQHELYLYLLDIHILQKDEFAISQLISHVHSLELDDIIAQAEAKQANFDKAQNKTVDTIAFTSPTEPASAAKPQAQNTADFDALMGSPSTAPEPKKEATPAPVVATPAVEEIKPLDFNLSFDSVAAKPAEVVAEKPQEAQTLDFAAPEVAPVAKVAEAAPAAEIKPLDFSLDFAPQTSPEVAQPEPTAEPAPLDFSFTTEEPATETQKAEPLSFDLSSIGAQPEAELAPTAPASTGVSFDISQVSTPASGTDQNDPLVQSFPELLDSNEITLNLELAAQYIQLGAFDAAREILEEKESEYTAEQIEQVKLLRNQIAS
ncbi:fimbrial protein FimV [Acinetobacter sp. SWAC5]|uniref:fimbrial protein FimV n=1 Tax=Acinetobacter sp. SWAC5 TaxID=2293835 RepID=UPI000E352F43|nr:fimbrial protein FimV [Acinetobacter sp. SWAC5]RFS33903.1 fimbrial protein FimV [Acinetobacter sp. SWAC5]